MCTLLPHLNCVHFGPTHTVHHHSFDFTLHLLIIDLTIWVRYMVLGVLAASMILIQLMRQYASSSCELEASVMQL